MPPRHIIPSDIIEIAETYLNKIEENVYQWHLIEISLQHVVTYDFRALQVKDEVFERIQEEHFDRLRRCLDDRKAAFEILCGNSQMDEADKLLNLSEEDPLPKSVMTTLRRYRKPVAEMPQNPDHDQNERKEIENSGSSFTCSSCSIQYAT